MVYKLYFNKAVLKILEINWPFKTVFSLRKIVTKELNTIKYTLCILLNTERTSRNVIKHMNYYKTDNKKSYFVPYVTHTCIV